jgi:hypothetical protein
MCALEYDMGHLKSSISFLLETSNNNRTSVESQTSVFVNMVLNHSAHQSPHEPSTALATFKVDSAIEMNANFYTYAIHPNVDFLTTTFSPYFRTKITYAFILFSCIVLNSFILFYYYLKAAYFNPWHKFYSKASTNCSFCDHRMDIDTDYISNHTKTSTKSPQILRDKNHQRTTIKINSNKKRK